MNLVSVFFFISLCLIGQSAMATSTNIASLFEVQEWSSPNTELSIPGTSDFTNATSRWNIYRAPSYGAALSVGSEEDVVAAVKIATANYIPFLATGGRHGYGKSLGELQDGLAIDLGGLKKLDIDASAGTITVGPGVTIGDIFDPLYETGYQLQTGVCSCAGMIGVTLGAGIGRSQGQQGLMLDALQSARVVTASGEVLEASATSNEDLFWAIRGAGQNFGIVTSATYKLHPVTQDYTSIDLGFPARLHQEIFRALAEFDTSPEWAIAGNIAYDADAGEPVVQTSCVYHGPRDKALALLSPLLAVGPTSTNITEIPWNHLAAVAAFGSDAAICAPGKTVSIYGVNLRQRDPEAWTSAFVSMAELYENYPAARGSVVVFEIWSNQAVRAIPDEDTAYPWRDADTYVMIQNYWPANDTSTGEAATSNASKIRDALAATSGYGGLTVYVNYANGDETLEQIYGEEKLPRLVELKRRHDPENVFRFHHGLPVVYP
ncbi:FAD-binding oxidoreductase [Aspergillus undulatus]|uniref:FAD-binding oxidoreductase n=1 Tax=Aspergillus undulatus TaxID=1810928 RepID=UPI003CCDDE04